MSNLDICLESIRFFKDFSPPGCIRYALGTEVNTFSNLSSDSLQSNICCLLCQAGASFSRSWASPLTLSPDPFQGFLFGRFVCLIFICCRSLPSSQGIHLKSKRAIQEYFVLNADQKKMVLILHLEI